MIEKTVWQDAKDFNLNVPVNFQNDWVYGKGRKSDVPDENLFASTNKMPKKLWFPLQPLGTVSRICQYLF